MESATELPASLDRSRSAFLLENGEITVLEGSSPTRLQSAQRQRVDLSGVTRSQAGRDYWWGIMRFSQEGNALAAAANLLASSMRRAVASQAVGRQVCPSYISKYSAVFQGIRKFLSHSSRISRVR